MTTHRFAAFAAFAYLVCASATVLADDHAYSEGPVVNVSSIRTVDGKFDEYINWLGTTWKQLQEASKKAGYILSYEVLAAEPHNANEPDLYLVITYKNWAALDGALMKGDEISKQVEGSLTKANTAQVERSKVRTVLGSQTLQILQLK
jgi:hypothetical protein